MSKGAKVKRLDDYDQGRSDAIHAVKDYVGQKVALSAGLADTEGRQSNKVDLGANRRGFYNQMSIGVQPLKELRKTDSLVMYGLARGGAKDKGDIFIYVVKRNGRYRVFAEPMVYDIR